MEDDQAARNYEPIPVIEIYQAWDKVMVAIYKKYIYRLVPAYPRRRRLDRRAVVRQVIFVNVELSASQSMRCERVLSWRETV